MEILPTDQGFKIRAISSAIFNYRPQTIQLRGGEPLNSRALKQVHEPTESGSHQPDFLFQ